MIGRFSGHTIAYIPPTVVVCTVSQSCLTNQSINGSKTMESEDQQHWTSDQFDNEGEVAQHVAREIDKMGGIEAMPRWFYLVMVANEHHILGVSLTGCDGEAPPFVTETMKRANEIVLEIIDGMEASEVDGALFQVTDMSRHETEGPILMLEASVRTALMTHSLVQGDLCLTASEADLAVLENGVPDEWVAEFGGN